MKNFRKVHVIMFVAYPESSSRLDTCEKIRDYIFGGRGIVTLKSPTGVHHSYVFQRPKELNQFPDDVLFVYALHEGKQLFYVGMIENGTFRLTHHSRFLPNTPIVRGARYIMRMATEENLNTPMELYHEGVCAVCGRKLTSPRSILSGVGPRCRGRINAYK